MKINRNNYCFYYYCICTLLLFEVNSGEEIKRPVVEIGNWNRRTVRRELLLMVQNWDGEDEMQMILRADDKGLLAMAKLYNLRIAESPEEYVPREIPSQRDYYSLVIQTYFDTYNSTKIKKEEDSAKQSVLEEVKEVALGVVYYLVTLALVGIFIGFWYCCSRRRSKHLEQYEKRVDAYAKNFYLKVTVENERIIAEQHTRFDNKMKKRANRIAEAKRSKSKMEDVDKKSKKKNVRGKKSISHMKNVAGMKSRSTMKEVGTKEQVSNMGSGKKSTSNMKEVNEKRSKSDEVVKSKKDK